MYPIDDLVDGYLAALSVAGVEPPSSFRTEILRVPHVPPSLPSGFGAVYVFSLADVGKFGNAGPGRVLKVGKVGAS